MRKGAFQLFGNIYLPTLIGMAAIVILAVTGFNHYQTSFELIPNKTAVITGEQIILDVIVKSTTPVNVFSGTVTFSDPTTTIENINYNISIAELWTETPWYKNGTGAVHFAGGTTAPGGFVGSGVLMQITFRMNTPGRQQINVKDGRILASDGLGSETNVWNENIFITATGSPVTIHESSIHILPPKEFFDLNNDGIITLVDISQFFIFMATQNPQADFNQDSQINIADFSMLLAAHRAY